MFQTGRQTHNFLKCITEGASLLPLCLIAFGCDRNSGTLVPLEFMPAPITPKTTRLVVKNICPSVGYTIKDVFAVHATMKLGQGKIGIDFDRDGLSNSQESELGKEYNVSFKSADTNGDGFSDLLMVTGGFVRSQQSALHQCENPDQDTDLDGLFDCEEENITHTNPKDPDSDDDGIVDGIEVRFGLNPSDGTDSFQDPDNDGENNYNEVKANTPPGETNIAAFTTHALKYTLTAIQKDGRECKDLDLSQIPLLQVSNGNLLRIFVLETKPASDANEGTVNRTTYGYKSISYENAAEIEEVEYDNLSKKDN